MDEIKTIPLEELKTIAGERNLDIETIIKDYYLTHLLYLIKNIEGLCFKGGTALYKVFLNNLRLSEDIDFTVKGDLRHVEKQIREKVMLEKVFKEITHDKRTTHFTRLIVHYISPLWEQEPYNNRSKYQGKNLPKNRRA